MAGQVFAQECAHGLARVVAIHSVQIQLGLNDPMPAPQLAQRVPRIAFLQIAELGAGVEGVVDRHRAERLGERRALVEHPLLRNGIRPARRRDALLVP
jgi:hypothetical protein